MHSEDKLKGLDPTSPQDPQGDAARSVMAAAIARGSESEAQEPRKRLFRRPRILVGVGGTSAAAIAAVVAFVGGGSTIGAAAALADAVAQTAGFSSGVVTVHTVANNGGTALDSTQTIKFSGSDWDVTSHSVETVTGSNPATHDLDVRQVGGKQYQLNGDDATPAWAVTGDATADQVGSAVATDGLVDLVKSASDVSQNGNTFHATVDGAALKALPTTPLGLDDAAASGPVSVTVTVGDDGNVSKLEIDTDGVTRTTEFSGLGADQTIDTPQP